MWKSPWFKYALLNLALVVLAFAGGRFFSADETRTRAGLPAAQGNSTRESSGDLAVVRGKIATQQKPVTSGNPTDEAELERTLDRFAQSLNSDQMLEKLTRALLALAETNPKAAIDFAVRDLHPPFQGPALAKVLDIWAKNDPQSAWDWVRANKADDYPMTDSVLMRIARTQPDTAWKFAAQLGATRPDAAAGLYVSAMKGMMHEGQYGDVARLMENVALPDKAKRADYGLASFLAGQWVQSDPARASEWALDLPEGSDARRQALVGLTEYWPQIAPQDAAQFAADLPPSPERVAMLSASIDQWFATDPEQAKAWIADVPRGADYDQFAAAISSAPKIVDSDPETSISWAQSISDSSLQLDSMTRIFQHWLEVADGAPALSYLQSSPALPLAARREISRRLQLKVDFR